MSVWKMDSSSLSSTMFVISGSEKMIFIASVMASVVVVWLAMVPNL